MGCGASSPGVHVLAEQSDELLASVEPSKMMALYAEFKAHDEDKRLGEIYDCDFMEWFCLGCRLKSLACDAGDT